MTFHAADPCKFNYPEDHDANGGSSLNVTLRWPADHSSDFHGLPVRIPRRRRRGGSHRLLLLSDTPHMLLTLGCGRPPINYLA